MPNKTTHKLLLTKIYERLQISSRNLNEKIMLYFRKVDCIILSMYVYNTSKIIKYGMLVRMLCESVWAIYICKLHVYYAQAITLFEIV